MKEVITAIQNKDWKYILQKVSALNDKERYAFLEELDQLDFTTNVFTEPAPKTNFPSKESEEEKKIREEYYKQRNAVENTFHYAKIVCVRKYADLKKIPTVWSNKISLLHLYLKSSGTFRHSIDLSSEPLIEFFKLFPPDYLDKIVKENSKDRQRNNNFWLLWALYKEGFIQWDEEVFVQSFFSIGWHLKRDFNKDFSGIVQYPELVQKVILPFHNYEIPILDICSWYENGESGRGKGYDYWDKMFLCLIEENLISTKDMIPNILSSLTFLWKKGHLDWFVRLLKLFRTTKEEYLEYQYLLFPALNSTSNTVVNFIVQTIQSIYKDSGFNAELFLQNVPVLLGKDKLDKSILIALDILEYLGEKYPDNQELISETISTAYIQPNDKIQKKVTDSILKFKSKEKARELTEPYSSTLKPEIRKILGVEEHKTEMQSICRLVHTPIFVPDTWEDFLFHFGKTLSSESAVDVDFLYEGFIQMQDQLPPDFEKQLKPHIKKITRERQYNIIPLYISEFVQNWLSGSREYTIEPKLEKYNHFPFLRNRNQWVLNKIKNKSKVPLLSTPTHSPFYIHAEILIERLLEYEKTGEKVELEDLIIACNRILFSQITEKAKKEAQKLTGNYSQAVQYLLGIYDKITPEKELLPLWTQITRIRNPEGIFTEFEKTSAGEYPVVVNPFQLNYEIKRDFSESGEYHWDRLYIDKNWSNQWRGGKFQAEYPSLFYYTAYTDFDVSENTCFIYRLTQIPHYTESHILKYIPGTASGNEVTEFEFCQYPLQFILENELRLYHAGWVYIAQCLIFEKKISRDLAAEYINLALQRNFLNQEYLTQCIGYMIAKKYAPVNRLIEYLDKENPKEIKEFQLLLLEKCIENIEKDNLPVNLKKLTVSYLQICDELQVKPENGIEEKIKYLAKK